MELKEALSAHYAWRQRFRDALDSGDPVDIAAVSKDDQCQLGQWLYSEGAEAYGTMVDFAKVRAAHAAFHTEVGKVGELVNHHQRAEVEEQLNGGSTPFANASTAVNMALMHFFRVVDAQGPECAP